jgi:hypothetical protein
LDGHEIYKGEVIIHRFAVWGTVEDEWGTEWRTLLPE